VAAEAALAADTADAADATLAADGLVAPQRGRLQHHSPRSEIDPATVGIATLAAVAANAAAPTDPSLDTDTAAATRSACTTGEAHRRRCSPISARPASATHATGPALAAVLAPAAGTALAAGTADGHISLQGAGDERELPSSDIYSAAGSIPADAAGPTETTTLTVHPGAALETGVSRLARTSSPEPFRARGPCETMTAATGHAGRRRPDTAHTALTNERLVVLNDAVQERQRSRGQVDATTLGRGAGAAGGPRSTDPSGCTGGNVALHGDMGTRHVPAIDQDAAPERCWTAGGPAIVRQATGDRQVLQRHRHRIAGTTDDLQNAVVPGAAPARIEGDVALDDRRSLTDKGQ
jgi:hypothetical protein